jgi:hypothetical protein
VRTRPEREWHGEKRAHSRADQRWLDESDRRNFESRAALQLPQESGNGE